MNDESRLRLMIHYAGSDAGRSAYESMVDELARLRRIEAAAQSSAVSSGSWTVLDSYERADGSRTWRAMGPWRTEREEAIRDAEHGSMRGAPDRSTSDATPRAFARLLALYEQEQEPWERPAWVAAALEAERRSPQAMNGTKEGDGR